jgi:hypothetical protein
MDRSEIRYPDREDDLREKKRLKNEKYHRRQNKYRYKLQAVLLSDFVRAHHQSATSSTFQVS